MSPDGEARHAGGGVRIRFSSLTDVTGEYRVIGKQGRVTGRIGPGLVGEVMVAVRGGVEAFYAHPTVPDEEIAPTSIVVIVEFFPPRTVYVARALP